MQHAMTRTLAWSAWILLAPLGRSQMVLHDLSGGTALDSYGRSTDPLGDVDQDGFPDFLVGPFQLGDVEIRSGKTGGLIRSISIPHIPNEVHRAFDLDGDGIEDVVVGTADLAPQMAVYSGQTGTLLLAANGPKAFHARVAGDFDGDGFLDYLTTSEQSLPTDMTPVLIEMRLYSGQLGTVLLSSSASSVAGVAAVISAAGDVNADGFDDVLLGNTPYALPHSVDVRGGPAGAPLATVTVGGDRIFDLDLAGDDDGDGTPDFLVTSAALNPDLSGHVAFDLISGRTGSAIRSIDGATQFPKFGHLTGAYLGDVDGDGVADVAYGAAYGTLISSYGTIETYSGADGDRLFAIDQDAPNDFLGHEISAGGDQDGDGYAEVIGSAAGFMGVGSYTRVYSSCARTTPAADGCPGAAGVAPRLRRQGCLAVGTPLTLTVKDALAGSVAFFLVGAQPASLALGAGCMLGVAPAGAVLAGPFAVSTSGSGVGDAPWTIGVPAIASGSTFYCQGVVLDSASPVGIEVTGTLALDVP